MRKIKEVLPFCFDPVLPRMHIDSYEWYLVTKDPMFWPMFREDIFHRLPHQGFPCFDFIFRDIEDELIMHLEYHRATEVFLANFRIYIEHSIFEHICGGSLYWHIYAFSLGNTSDSLIGIGESWDIPSPPKSGLDISESSSLFEDRLIVVLHSWIALIERFYIFLCFPWWRTERLRETKSRDPIDHSEIHGLRDTSLLS